MEQIADRVRRLSPCHRDPERFHAEKSDIEAHFDAWPVRAPMDDEMNSIMIDETAAVIDGVASAYAEAGGSPDALALAMITTAAYGLTKRHGAVATRAMVARVLAKVTLAVGPAEGRA